MDAGSVAIACGGGGIPSSFRIVIISRGVPAVIDKDLGGELLAELLDADILIILTAVEKVAVNFGKPDQQWLDRLTPAEAPCLCGGGPVRSRQHAAQRFRLL